jgi:hypothetical protein
VIFVVKYFKAQPHTGTHPQASSPKPLAESGLPVDLLHLLLRPCIAAFGSIVPVTVEPNISTTIKLANTAAEAGLGVCGHDTERVSCAALPNGAIFGSLLHIGLSAKPFSACVVKPAAAVISVGYCGAPKAAMLAAVVSPRRAGRWNRAAVAGSRSTPA